MVYFWPYFSNKLMILGVDVRVSLSGNIWKMQMAYNVYSYKYSAKIIDASQSIYLYNIFFSCCKFQGDGQDWNKYNTIKTVFLR